jgi:iron complex transport system substrate-binding protein
MGKRLLWLGFICGLSFGAVAAELNTSRVVSIDANATGILIGFGLADSIVAVDVTSQMLVSDKGLPNLGYHRALSAEGVLSTEPSLVIGSNHMGPVKVIDTLNAAGIPLIQLQAATNSVELVTNIRFLGDQLGLESHAGELIEQVTGQQQLISQRAEQQSLSMVFLLDMSERGLSKAGAGTTGAALVSLLGGQGLSSYGGYQSIAIEALLELDPDVILIGGEEPGADAAQAFLAKHPLLAHTRAVKNNRLLNVDSGTMVAGVSLGVMDEAERLSRLVYP